MQSAIVGIVLVAIVVVSGLYLFWYPRWRRQRILAQEFPAEWEAILTDQLPIYHKLTPALQHHLKELIRLFIDGKNFIGCAGVTVNEEMKVVIASQASLLLLNRPSTEYQNLHSIYIYPSSFRATREVRDELGLVSTRSDHMLGESWETGKVILAWDEVEKGIRNFTDGHNVVLHEFAHQLDHESGVTNGAPLLHTKGAYKSWAYVFSKEFEKLQQADSGVASIIDHYGATNPAEFFAVATETFFEEPRKLKAHHRELYDQLEAYYRVDPEQWL